MNRWSSAPARVRFRCARFRGVRTGVPRRRSRAARAAQDRGHRDRRRVAEADAGDRRQPVLVLRARVPRVRDAALSDGAAREQRLRGRDRRFRHAVLVVGDVGQRRARDRARLGHRRHSESVADARRRVSRAADRRRARPWRRSQLRSGRQHRRRARRESRSCSASGCRARSSLWPGVAEELLAAKAWFVRDGRFDGVDAVLFTHVGARFGTAWGHIDGTGLVSVEYSFEGTAAHSAVMPWRGRSALDAVELMNIGWNFRREHLNPTQRSHYVIVDGGDQPNVVPPAATVWYFVREIDAPSIRQNFDDAAANRRRRRADDGHDAARRIVGAAWPRHFNRPLALAMQRNIDAVGMPQWSENDQAFARALQQLLEVPQTGLADRRRARSRSRAACPCREAPTTSATCRGSCRRRFCSYPSNVPGMTAHHWSSAMAMATPIAHKGATAGAKVIAATLLDLIGRRGPACERRALFHRRAAQGHDLRAVHRARRRAADREEPRDHGRVQGALARRCTTTRRASIRISSSSASSTRSSSRPRRANAAPAGERVRRRGRPRRRAGIPAVP